MKPLNNQIENLYSMINKTNNRYITTEVTIKTMKKKRYHYKSLPGFVYFNFRHSFLNVTHLIIEILYLGSIYNYIVFVLHFIIAKEKQNGGR